jgi:hypothetical protein
MNKYWKFQGKIITLSSFLSAPKKRVQFAYFGPTADIREKMVGAESVKELRIPLTNLWNAVISISVACELSTMEIWGKFGR